MKTFFSSVQRTNSSIRPTPRICFGGGWLPEYGFVFGSLAQTKPETNGMDFVLCEDIEESYSDLAYETQSMRGRLVQVFNTKVNKYSFPSLSITGKYISECGLEIGDKLIIRCENGLIQLRKFVNDNTISTKYIRGLSIIDKLKEEPALKIRLGGEWLNEYGFEEHQLVTVESSPNGLIIQLCDEIVKQYGSLKEYANEHKFSLYRIREGRKSLGKPCIELSGSCLDMAGFELDEIFSVNSEYGMIIVKKLDFEAIAGGVYCG
jgi:hypothetical protein